VVDVVGEDPLDDPAAGMRPGLVPLGSPDLFLERRERPAIETRVDDPEGRVEGGRQLIRAEDVLEVVVPPGS
jgi:hypothetical protein